MYLTGEEEKLLRDSHPLVQEAMTFLVKLGEAFDAERMIDIDYVYTYIYCSAWGKGRLSRELLEDAVKAGVRVKVPTLGVGSHPDDPRIFKAMKIPEEALPEIKFEHEMSRALGFIPVSTCAPYVVCDLCWNSFGCHLSSIESSAIAYFNSVLGARTNRDGIASLWAALTGKYPLFGYHLDENRAGTHLIEVEAELEDALDFGLLGFYAGKNVGLDVPVFTGIRGARNEWLRSLSAAVATGGAVTLYHIVGTTPEAHTLETALRGRKPQEEMTFTQADLDEVRGELIDEEEGDVDFVCLGCPHYSIYELWDVARLLEGRRVKEGVTLWVMTPPQVYELAKWAEVADVISEAGGTLIYGSTYYGHCTFISPGIPGPTYTFTHPEYSIGNFATDSVKQAYYAKPLLRAKKVFLGSKEKCIEAAVTGKWR